MILLLSAFSLFCFWPATRIYMNQFLQPQQFVIDNIHDTFEPDALTTSHAIQLPVYHPDEIGEIFDRISYGKVYRSFFSNAIHSVELSWYRCESFSRRHLIIKAFALFIFFSIVAEYQIFYCKFLIYHVNLLQVTNLIDFDRFSYSLPDFIFLFYPIFLCVAILLSYNYSCIFV